MKSKIFKIIAALLSFFCLLIFTSQLILAFPGFLLKEKHSYKNFLVLSDKPVEPNFDKRLGVIADKLAKTGFYREEEKFTIIICHGNGLAKFFNIISLASEGVGFQHFTGNIYLFGARIARFKEENTLVSKEHQTFIEYSYQSFDFDTILMHEMLHKLHSDSLGFWQFKTKMPSPNWKVEGFAEYYTYYQEKAIDKNYDFHNRVSKYLEYKDTFPLFYYRSQLLYEYLSDYEKMSFPDIMSDSVTEEYAFNKLMQWYNTQKSF